MQTGMDQVVELGADVTEYRGSDRKDARLVVGDPKRHALLHALPSIKS